MPGKTRTTRKSLSQKMDWLSALLEQESRQIMRIDMRLSQLMEQYSLQREQLTRFLAVIVVTDGLMESAQNKLAALEKRMQGLKNTDTARFTALLEEMEAALTILEQADLRLSEMQTLLEDMETSATQYSFPRNLRREPFWDSDPRFFLERDFPFMVTDPADSYYVS